MATALSAMYRGNTKSYVFTIKVNGVAEDLTGTSVIFTIKEHTSDTATLYSQTNTTHDVTTGQTTFSITKAQSILFPVGELDADVTWLFGSNVLTTGVYTIEILEPPRTPE